MSSIFSFSKLLKEQNMNPCLSAWENILFFLQRRRKHEQVAERMQNCNVLQPPKDPKIGDEKPSVNFNFFSNFCFPCLSYYVITVQGLSTAGPRGLHFTEGNSWDDIVMDEWFKSFQGLPPKVLLAKVVCYEFVKAQLTKFNGKIHFIIYYMEITYTGKSS